MTQTGYTVTLERVGLTRRLLSSPVAGQNNRRVLRILSNALLSTAAYTSRSNWQSAKERMALCHGAQFTIVFGCSMVIDHRYSASSLLCDVSLRHPNPFFAPICLFQNVSDVTEASLVPMLRSFHSALVLAQFLLIIECVLDKAPINANPWDVDGPCQEHVEVCCLFLFYMKRSFV